MSSRPRLTAALVATGALLLAGCEAEEPISPDPEGLEDPADDPEGVDAPLEDEPGAGEPAVEGDGEGRLVPDEDDGE